MPALIDWIDSMPPSMTAMRRLSAFGSELVGSDEIKFEDPVSKVPRIARAYNAMTERIDQRNKHPHFMRLAMATDKIYHEFNPKSPFHYKRPEIIFSLQRGYWWEVPFGGLVNTAYFNTTYEMLDSLCPGLISSSQYQKLTGNTTFGTLTHDQIFKYDTRGVSSSRTSHPGDESLQRSIGNLNSPGCIYYKARDTLICTTREQYEESVRQMLFSYSARHDIDQFINSNTCSSEATEKYIADLLNFDPSMKMPKDFMPPYPF